ncbi:MAG: glycosyltransferase family 2 protein [Bryobacterales bacterium]|nr:glycosyltransferase family 2 protein [Bryobacterales bacterium]
MISISIVIPAYNEEQRLPSTLDAITAYLQSRQWSFSEIVVVDDGSRDGTAALVGQRAALQGSIRLLRNPGNRGKGFSVRHGMLEAKGEWRLFSDADLSTPIEELDKLLAEAERTGAALAIGSRALDRGLVTRHQSPLREFAGRTFNLLMRLSMRLPYRDSQCGFKLFRAHAAREIFRRARLDGFGFDVEVLFLARKLRLPAVELPVRWHNVEGTKVTLGRGLNAFFDLARIRWQQAKGYYRL